MDCQVPECRLTVLKLLPRQSTLEQDMDTAGHSQDALGPSAMCKVEKDQFSLTTGAILPVTPGLHTAV